MTAAPQGGLEKEDPTAGALGELNDRHSPSSGFLTYLLNTSYYLRFVIDRDSSTNTTWWCSTTHPPEWKFHFPVSRPLGSLRCCANGVLT